MGMKFVPSHAFVLHDSWDPPTHALPPFLGSGLVQVLIRVPPPHVLEHSLKAENPPCTETNTNEQVSSCVMIEWGIGTQTSDELTTGYYCKFIQNTLRQKAERTTGYCRKFIQNTLRQKAERHRNSNVKDRKTKRHERHKRQKDTTKDTKDRQIGR